MSREGGVIPEQMSREELVEALTVLRQRTRDFEVKEKERQVLVLDLEVQQAELELQNHELRESQRALEASIAERERVEAELVRARDREHALRARFQTLDRFSMAMSRALARTPEELLQTIAHEVRRAADAEYAALGIGDDPDQPFTAFVFSGISTERAVAIGRRPHPRGVLGLAIRTSRSVRVGYLGDHQAFGGFPPHHPEMRSFLSVAVPDGTHPIGHLYVTNKRSADEFSEDDLRMLELMARRAGLAIEIARLSQEVHAAVRARDNLLAVVSHDLRTPLSAIELNAMLVARTTESANAGIQRHVEVILRSAGRMRRLIDDLLQAATIEAGKFAVTLAPEDPSTIAHESIDALEAVATSKQVALQLEVDRELPEIRCDRQRIIQVLDNLIGNALKFAPARGRVRLCVTRDAETVRWAVVDDGPGIPQDQRDHLFDRYWQGSDDHRGVGLGLFIAKAIVEAHGGRLMVASQPNAGSTFTFTLPVLDAAASRDHPDGPRPHQIA